MDSVPLDYFVTLISGYMASGRFLGEDANDQCLEEVLKMLERLGYKKVGLMSIEELRRF